MREFGAQLRRELGEGWPLWAAALVLGLVPVLAPWMASQAASAEEVAGLRTATAILVTALYCLATLAMLGDGLLARDVAEGRLGFFLARPLSATSLWAARLVAALVLFAAVALALVTPTWLASGSDAATRSPSLATVAVTAPGATTSGLFEPLGHPLLFRVLGVAGTTGLLLSLLLLVHGVGTSARSRSAWSLLDVTAATVAAVTLLATHDVLVSATAFGALVAAERLFVVALAAVLVVAGHRQLVHGRSDLGRGHRAFSCTTWPLVAALVLALYGAALWVASPDADDLVSVEQLWTSADGRLLGVGGELAHRLGMRADALFPADDPASGRVIGRVTDVASARAGDLAAWIGCRRFVRPDCRVWTWRPGTSDAPAATDIELDRWGSELAVSPFGELVAVADSRLEVWQPGVPRLVFASDQRAHRPAFLSATRLRYLHPDYVLDTTALEELDLTTRKVRRIAELPGQPMPQHVRMSVSGRWAAVGAMLPPRLQLVDAERGVVRDLQQPGDGGEPAVLATTAVLLAVRFVGDDLVVLGRSSDGPTQLLRVRPTGEESAIDVEVAPLPLPAQLSATGVAARMAPFGDGILLSGATRAEVVGSDLPAGVTALPGVATWYLDLSADPAWRLVAGGLVLPGWSGRRLSDPVDAAPQAAFLLAGCAAVVQLQDGALRLVVPALPRTDAGALVGAGAP